MSHRTAHPLLTPLFLLASVLSLLIPASASGDARPGDGGVKTVHVFVALCDNRYQGIVPVPAALGNGQNPGGNLYWGALYGVRTYFRRSGEWRLLATLDAEAPILERLVFKHAAKNYYLVADAYDGRRIKQCTIDFLNGSSGNKKDSLRIDGNVLGLGGNATLLAYIGHNGLMDFDLSDSDDGVMDRGGGRARAHTFDAVEVSSEPPPAPAPVMTFPNADNRRRDVIILACYSKRFFGPHLQAANVNPLLWTTHLMAPEAYILHAALAGYVSGEPNESIRERAAAAYAKYQKCGLRAARNLLVTGW